MRLDKRIAIGAGLPRKRARIAVRGGRVRVGDAVERDPGRRIEDDEPVTLDEQPVPPAGSVYLVLHKPTGTECSRNPSHHAGVHDLLPAAFARRVEPVGRLDADTTGLLLLTDDGPWAHGVMAPRAGCPKTYVATLRNDITDEQLDALRTGVFLRNEARPTAPAVVERLAPRQALVTVTEGRYHLVRRLWASQGNKVLALHRRSVGPLSLDLDEGEWRRLSPPEVAALRGD